ncbi:Serine/threonine-protein kinase AtPK2/AtPK19, partial [Linum grandiflorum]
MTDELRNLLELYLPKLTERKKPKFKLSVGKPKVGSSTLNTITASRQLKFTNLVSDRNSHPSLTLQTSVKSASFLVRGDNTFQEDVHPQVASSSFEDLKLLCASVLKSGGELVFSLGGCVMALYGRDVKKWQFYGHYGVEDNLICCCWNIQLREKGTCHCSKESWKGSRMNFSGRCSSLGRGIELLSNTTLVLLLERKRGEFAQERQQLQIGLYEAETVSDVSHFHDCWMVHQDLEPRNIFSDVEGYIMLTDLGDTTVFTEIGKGHLGVVIELLEYSGNEIPTLENGFSQTYKQSHDVFVRALLINVQQYQPTLHMDGKDETVENVESEKEDSDSNEHEDSKKLKQKQQEWMQLKTCKMDINYQ